MPESRLLKVYFGPPQYAMGLIGFFSVSSAPEVDPEYDFSNLALHTLVKVFVQSVAHHIAPQAFSGSLVGH